MTLDIVADRPELLQVSPQALTVHRNLVQQAYKLFGSHHYDHYDFLLSLSDQMGGNGLEHHQSSEDGTDPTTSCTGSKWRGARSPLARVHALLERQIPPSGRSVDAELQRADA